MLLYAVTDTCAARMDDNSKVNAADYVTLLNTVLRTEQNENTPGFVPEVFWYL